MIIVDRTITMSANFLPISWHHGWKFTCQWWCLLGPQGPRPWQFRVRVRGVRWRWCRPWQWWPPWPCWPPLRNEDRNFDLSAPRHKHDGNGERCWHLVGTPWRSPVQRKATTWAKYCGPLSSSLHKKPDYWENSGWWRLCACGAKSAFQKLNSNVSPVSRRWTCLQLISRRSQQFTPTQSEKESVARYDGKS